MVGMAAFVYLGIIVLMIVSLWKIFEKAGKPGWASLVPIYNMIVLLEIIDKPVWWIALFLVPLVNFVMIFIVYIELAKCFGKSAGFGVGMVFLSFIFIPLLAFGDAEYLDGENMVKDGSLDANLV